MVRRSEQLFPDAFSKDRPDNTLDVRILNDELDFADPATEPTLAETAVVLDDVTSTEHNIVTESATQSAEVMLHTFGKPDVVAYYDLTGDADVYFETAMYNDGPWREVEVYDTTEADVDQTDIRYLPWSTYEFSRLRVDASSNIDATVELVANR